EPRRATRRVGNATVAVSRSVSGAATELRWLLNDETQQAVERANTLKTELIARVSHELRTPLSAVSGYAELLLLGVHGDLSAQQAGVVQRIIHAERHMLRLLDDLLTYFKLGSGRLSVEIQRVRLLDVLDQARTLIQPQTAA